LKLIPKKLIIGAVLLLIFQGNLLSAEEKKPETPLVQPKEVTHILGDQAFAFSLGAYIPLFFYQTSSGTVENTNLFIGAKGSLEYITYLSNTVTFSIELTGGFAFSPNFNIYWTLPITGKISYIVYFGDGEYELFLTMGLGVDFESFLGNSRMDFIVRPQVSFCFPLDPKLKLGVGASYWFIPQIATADQEANKPDQSRLGNFLDISISLIYNF
jgi:hypothetical protein